MSDGKFVSYYRVSTERQGQSGLGLEAQKEAVNRWLGTNQHELVSEHVEIESGRRDDRPELAAAIKDAKKAGATLVIAKLDRLARDIYTISRLMRSGVKFVAVDNPHANELTVHLLAVMAEHDAKQISERTKAALKTAKARGVKFGAANPLIGVKGVPALQKARGGQIQRADKGAAEILPIIDGIRAVGITTLDGIADALNKRGVATARGGQWYPSTVRRILMRPVSQ
ncbi:recombinase family protein [bacterium]|nr:recombinase family protein [bacterium]